MNEKINSMVQHIPNFIWDALLISVAILASFTIRFLFIRPIKLYKKKKKTNQHIFLRSLVTHAINPLSYVICMLLLNLMVPFMVMNRSLYPSLYKTLEVLLIAASAWFLISSIKVLEEYVYHKYNLSKKVDNLKERKIRTQLQFIRKVIIVFIILVAIALVLLSFESVKKVGAGLITSVGVAGIIISLAAQKSLGNLLAGFQIAFTQPIRIDDVLLVEGEWGRVEDITLTYVVVSIWDGRRMILPLNYFIEKPFQNWTRTSSEIIGSVYIYMDYTICLEELRQEFNRLLNETTLWNRSISALQVTDAKEGTMEIRAIMSGVDSPTVFDLRCYVREHLITYIQRNYPNSLPRKRISLEKS